jgi:hypothetical protein
MAKFRKKPIVIEAEQFTGESVFGLRVERHVFNKDDGPFLFIPTLEGRMTANVGDWIIRGVNNELYPCKDEIFKKSYEAVDG